MHGTCGRQPQACSPGDLSLPLFGDSGWEGAGISKSALHQIFRPPKMFRSPGDRFRFAMHIDYFPNGNPLAKNVRLAPADMIAETDAGEFLLECFFFEVEAAQG